MCWAAIGSMPMIRRCRCWPNTSIARIWDYVRNELGAQAIRGMAEHQAPFGGTEPPGVVCYYARNRRGEHPQGHLAGYSGILQVDRFAGFNEMFRTSGMTRANCWVHARRQFFVLVDVARNLKRPRTGAPPPVSPLAREALERIDRIFAIEHAINGQSAAERLRVRQEQTAPLVHDLETWMRTQIATLSRHDAVAKAIAYLLNDWPGFTAFLDDGRICLSNNAAERELRSVAHGRKAWLFVGSDRGGERAAMMYSFFGTARLNGVDPLAWFTHVLERIAEIPQNRLHELLPWNWKAAQSQQLSEIAA